MIIYSFISYISFSLLIWLTSFVLLYALISTSFMVNKSYYVKISITQAILSALHGLVCGTFGLFIMLECRNEVLQAESSLVLKYIRFGSGYMLYDIIAMYFVSSAGAEDKAGLLLSFGRKLESFFKLKTLLIIHHLVLVFVFFPVLLMYSTIGNFFMGCFFTMELSSVFVNLRIILSKLNLKTSKLYIVNGILMILTFFIVRILIFPFMFYMFVYQQAMLHEISYVLAFSKIPLKCKFSSLLVLVPQIYWISIMIKGALKLSYINKQIQNKYK